MARYFLSSSPRSKQFMFTAPRFIAVDDRPEHVKAIVDTFQRIGSPCMGILYNPAAAFEAQHFRGVRVLFIDLHLLEGAATTEGTRHFALIASILEDNIQPNGGPYVLVLWTQYDSECAALKDYLDANLDEQKPYVRPLAVFSLAKDRFLNIETGVVLDAAGLRQAVESGIRRNPQLAALLAWETAVLAAAGSTIAALLIPLPSASRSRTSFPGAIDTQLSRLAVAAVGKKNVPNDKRSAINAVLNPILSDRILNQAPSTEGQELWTLALTQDQQELADLDDREKGILNRMMHLALPPAEAVRPLDWGAVVDFPEAWKSDEEMIARFGVRLREILGGDLKIERNDRNRCRICAVRVGAVCDFAQSGKGPLPYLVGAEIPAIIERAKLPASEWKSPVMTIPSLAADSFHLVLNSRYLFTLTENEVQGFTVRYRLREQILMQLIAHAGQYVTRPGIVSVV